MSFIYVGQQNEQSLYSKLIKIQCVVEDCEYNLYNSQLISVPAIINIDQQGDQKIIVYLCQEHLHKPQIYENKLNTQITFCQRDVIKWLKVVSDRYPYEILLENSKIKLDAQSCCMRENIKYYNLQQILTILELISNDNDIISNLVNRELVKKKIQISIKANKSNILQNLVLIHQKKATSFLSNTIESLIDSKDFLQPNNSKGPNN
ncbi:hypothetical protein pb186bvf_019006 [Paramecium bursaria]